MFNCLRAGSSYVHPNGININYGVRNCGCRGLCVIHTGLVDSERSQSFEVSLLFEKLIIRFVFRWIGSFRNCGGLWRGCCFFGGVNRVWFALVGSCDWIESFLVMRMFFVSVYRQGCNFYICDGCIDFINHYNWVQLVQNSFETFRLEVLWIVRYFENKIFFDTL